MTEPNTLLQSAAGLLGAAALGGLVMAAMRFTGTPRPPNWLAMAHGLLAGAGLTLLAYAALTVGIPQMGHLALGILLIAGVGGAAINLMYHAQMQPLPKPLMVLHALLAVTGFALLLWSIYLTLHAEPALPSVN